MRKLRKMKLIEVYAVAIFVIFLLFAIVFTVAFPNVEIGGITMRSVSVALILIDFPIALIAVIFASLSVREEKEERSAA